MSAFYIAGAVRRSFLYNYSLFPYNKRTGIRSQKIRLYGFTSVKWNYRCSFARIASAEIAHRSSILGLLNYKIALKRSSIAHIGTACRA